MNIKETLSNKSWKTTGAGIAAILVAVGAALTAFTDGDPATIPDFASLLAACLAGIGLIFAKDNKVKG
ncbi:hypothetical protein UFOVP942_41 [uncultured Caudovirales phage]|uniref:Uncharacterized protein n=1 Tax=uncultured Caudovirales phage TaxID=2100421 RepID=A0A6J5S349_9CAUD|nr:hypothetical protein UFOVP942_41 [uncultured Caudovirales phage]CAB4203354.1 hypothetical protein UFOVP1379_40 [uncultured Caudovirales phage]